MKKKNLIIAGAIALPVLATVATIASVAYMSYVFTSVCQNAPHKNYMKDENFENE